MAKAGAAQATIEADPNGPASEPNIPSQQVAPSADAAKAVAAAVVIDMDKRKHFVLGKRPNFQDDVKRHCGDSYQSDWMVRVPDEITPDDINAFPTYLYLTRERGVKRYDELRIHSRTFKWEGRWRVMTIDTETQEMILDPIGEPTFHKRRLSSFNWNEVDIEDMASAGFRLRFKDNVLPGSSFETREEAEEYINRKKSGVF